MRFVGRRWSCEIRCFGVFPQDVVGILFNKLVLVAKLDGVNMVVH